MLILPGRKLLRLLIKLGAPIIKAQKSQQSRMVHIGAVASYPMRLWHQVLVVMMLFQP